MKRVLITGGTGFIGSRLASRCLEAGEEVWVLAQRNNPAEHQNALALAEKGVRVVEGSVADRSALNRACEGVDAIYHLAAAQHEANVPDSHYFEVNVEGTRNLLDTAVASGVGTFVHGSTIGVYGHGNGGTVTEASPLEPDNIYGVTKLAAEEVVRSYVDRLPIPIVRISETYGPGDRRLLKLFRALSAGRLVRIGSGRNLHHPVYIDDLLDGLRLAADRPDAAGKTFVMAGPAPVTTDEMIDSISEAVGRRPPELRVPLWPLLGAATILEGILKPLGIQPPLHRRRMNFFVKSFRFDGSAAERAVGYRPSIQFADGAARTASWYRSANLL